MAEQLSKEELDRIIQTTEPISVTDYTQTNEESEDISNGSDLGRSAEAFLTGAFNQFNVLPTIAGINSAIGIDRLIGTPLPNADKMTMKQRYDLAKKVATYNARQMEDEHPIAYNSGNIAGGVGMSALPGGQFLSGAGLAKKGLALAKAGKALSGGEKLLANTLGNAVEGATQGYAFSREDDPSKEVMLAGSIGAGIPLAGSVAKKAFNKLAPATADIFMGANKKPARLYKERVKEIKQQRAEGALPVSDTEDALNLKIEENRTNYANDVGELTDQIDTKVKKATLDTQRNTEKMINEMKADRKKLQAEISNDSSKGWNELTDKQVDMDPIISQLDEELSKRTPGLDPTYDELIKVKESIVNRGNWNEKELKNFLNNLSEIAYAKPESVKYTPITQRILKRTYSVGRDVLSESNPKYAKIAKPISEKVKLLNDFDDVIDLDKVGVDSFKNFDTSLEMQDALSIFEGLTKKNYRNVISKNNKAYSVLTPLSGDLEKVQDKLLKAKEGSTDLKLLKRMLKRFDESYGTDLEKQYTNLRTKNDIPLSEQMEKLVVEKDGKTKFRKGMEKLDFQEVNKDQTETQKFFEGNESLDFNKKRVDDKYARDIINKVAKYLKTDPKKLARRIENARIENALEFGDPNGSKNVNLGIQLGKTVARNLGIAPDAIGALGGLLGKETDKGRLSRAYKKIIDWADTLQTKIDDPNQPASGFKNIDRLYEGSVRNLAPSYLRLEDRQQAGNDMVNNYFDNTDPFNNKNRVENQQDINMQYFKRSGSTK